MLSSHQVPVIVSVKKTTATKSLFAKILGLSAHIGILYISKIGRASCRERV